MTTLKNSNCEKKSNPQIVIKLKKANCDKTQNLNCDKTQQLKLVYTNKKSYNILMGDKTQKFLLWQHSKTQIMAKIKYLNCDTYLILFFWYNQKIELWQY